MLWGSLWDPEDEVKKNVEAYVDEVSLQTHLSSQLSEVVGCKMFETWWSMALCDISATTLHPPTFAKGQHLEHHC